MPAFLIARNEQLAGFGCIVKAIRECWLFILENRILNNAKR